MLYFSFYGNAFKKGDPSSQIEVVISPKAKYQDSLSFVE